MQKFAKRFPCAPKHFLRTVFARSFHETPHESRKYMSVYQVVSVVGAVQVARHQTDCVPAILQAEIQAKFITGDLGESITFIRSFQGPCQQIFLLDGLRSLTGINAAGTEETKFFHIVLKTLHNDIVLDFQIFQKEFRTVRFIGHNAAYFRTCQNHIVRLFRIEEIFDCRLIPQV